MHQGPSQHPTASLITSDCLANGQCKCVTDAVMVLEKAAGVSQWEHLPPVDFKLLSWVAAQAKSQQGGLCHCLVVQSEKSQLGSCVNEVVDPLEQKSQLLCSPALPTELTHSSAMTPVWVHVKSTVLHANNNTLTISGPLHFQHPGKSVLCVHHCLLHAFFPKHMLFALDI